MVTIHDVARACNMSVATVSRVLNGSDQVTQKTKDLVMDMIKELNYQPNVLGRNLRTKKTKMVLVFLSTILNPFYAKIVKGVEDVGHENGYDIMICTTYDDPKREQKYIELIKNRMADGAIFMTSTLKSDEITELGEKYNIVQCVECSKSPTVPSVTIDNENAAEEITQYLIDQGKNRILHLSSKDDRPSANDRLSGYKKALNANGLQFDESLIVYGNYGYRNAFEVIDNVIKSNLEFDSIFAISDRMAAGSISACIHNKIKVPSEKMVIGFDDVDISYINKPRITTVSQSQYEIGTIAMNMLCEKLSGNKEHIDDVIIKHKFVKRDSA